MSQAGLAEAVGVTKKTVVNWERVDERHTPIPADKLGLLHELGMDIQYILTGVSSSDFEARLRRLEEVTQAVMRIAQSRSRQPDPMQLGPLRDLAYSAKLTDQQIEMLFMLLERAREPGFWLDEPGRRQ